MADGALVMDDALESAPWRELVDHLPDPLLRVDESGEVRGCNATGLDWLGARREEVLDRPMAELFSAEDQEDLEQLVAAAWSWVTERRFHLADGRVVGLNAAEIPMNGARQFLVTLHDLTARQVLDQAEDQRRRMEALSELASAIAREMNDPMSIVQGRLELLLELEVTDPAAARRHLEVALDHARRISATLQNLRLVGRTHTPRPEAVNLAEACEAALQLVGPRSRDVQVDLQPHDLATSGEVAMYARVLANLVRRALDLSPRSQRVVVRGRVQKGAAPQVQILALGARGRVRERAEVVGVQGVRIDQTLLASVGGRLEVCCGPLEVGFTLHLPQAPRRRVRARRVQDHLLVVGSEPFRRIVEALVSREGYQITHVPDGEAALAALSVAEPPIDAVAAELLLHGMSGLGLAEAVLQAWPALHERVVLVSRTPVAPPPGPILVLSEPLSRRHLLEALGRRVR